MDKTNIFAFATKELSQDAFLCWLLENFDSDFPDVQEASLLLIKHLLNMPLNAPLIIDHLVTKKQAYKIDIICELTVNQVKHVIAIEDKTESFEHHEQLGKYNIYLDKYYPYHKQHRIFYKTAPMTQKETEWIESKGWSVFELRKIRKIFKINPDHYLLKSYIEHLDHLCESYYGALPIDIKNWTIKQWSNYASKLNIKLPEGIESFGNNPENRYYALSFNFKGLWDVYPYIGLLSRDIANKKFRMKIFTYGMNDQYVQAHIDEWKNKLSSSHLFKVQNHEKQIGCSKELITIDTVEDLEKVMVEYIHEYFRIIQ